MADVASRVGGAGIDTVPSFQPSAAPQAQKRHH